MSRIPPYPNNAGWTATEADVKKWLSLACAGVRPEWLRAIRSGWAAMPEPYKLYLSAPGRLAAPSVHRAFRPFRLIRPEDTAAVFLFESPFPQVGAARGMPLYPGDGDLWDGRGNPSPFVRAYPTLEAFLLMLRAAEGARRERGSHVSRSAHLFRNLAKKGILVLNATPVLGVDADRDCIGVGRHVTGWRPFNEAILAEVASATGNAAGMALCGVQARRVRPPPETRPIEASHPRCRDERRFTDFVEKADLRRLVARFDLLAR